MTLSCKQAGGHSLAVISGHASEAQRLELEDHLLACARCGEEHSNVRAFVRGLNIFPHDTLASTARAAIRQVVVTHAAGARPIRARATWGRRLVAGLMLASAATVGAIAVVQVTTLRDPPYRVLAGDVVVTPSHAGTPTPGADVVGTVGFRSTDGGRLRLPEAEVSLAHATEIVWTDSRRSLDLLRGDVTVDVDHRPGQHFEVRTPRFTVQVLGTRFTVDVSGVRTERGMVRIVRADGSIVAQVGAGQAWRIDGADAPDRGTVTPSASRLIPVPEPHHETKPRSDVRSVDATLSEARRALARGDAPAARRIVSRLFHLGRDVGVEARVLFAESFLVEGRYADAVDGYGVVVRDFPGTTQAESAQFAIAQLASEHGRPADARAALLRYVDGYPRGRFKREAEQRLSRLAPREQ